MTNMPPEDLARRWRNRNGRSLQSVPEIVPPTHFPYCVSQISSPKNVLIQKGSKLEHPLSTLALDSGGERGPIRR